MPQLFAKLVVAFTGQRGPLGSWVRDRVSTPDRVIAVLSDFLCGSTQPLAAELGIPHVVFSPSGVYDTAMLHSPFRVMPRPADENDDESPVRFVDIPHIQERRRATRGRYLERPLDDLGFRHVHAIGPLAPEADVSGNSGGETAMAASDHCTWLDKFADRSVVYFSFGSMVQLQPPHTVALAAFVWATGSHATLPLPEGFTEHATASGRGTVIRGWAPELSALRHRAVGWFVTHSGWNSILDAVAAGVTMLTWPIGADQFMNARLLVDEFRRRAGVLGRHRFAAEHRRGSSCARGDRRPCFGW
uniref:UDP-glycosyltransferases domain-containing protein n=1 Tax=Oryza punctata TaxID=4537 RepID=A0A0E0LAG1_ORYPU